MERPKFLLRLNPPTSTLENMSEVAATYNALNDFFSGSSFSFNTTLQPDGKYQLTKIPSDIVVQKIAYNEEKSQWNDPFFQFLWLQTPLSDEERQILSETGKRGKILMIRRTKAEDEFTRAVQDHSIQFHQGFSPYTELILTAYYNGHTLVDDEGEKNGLEKIKQTAQNAIKFYSLEEENEALKSIITKINEESNKYELIYNVYLALAALNRSNNRVSLASIVLGCLGVPILEEISKTWGDFASQVTSQIAGEIITMLTAAGDRIGEQLFSFKHTEKTIRTYFGLISQALINLPSHLKAVILEEAKRFSVNRQQFLHRLLILGLTTTIAVSLSLFSQYTHNLTPYALIPALNTSLITAYEIYERSKTTKSISEEEWNNLIGKIPKPLQFLFKKLPPNYVLAYSDFAVNNYAVGVLIGSFLATFSVFALQNFEIPKEVIYALSGMIIEPLTAIFYDRLKKQDPYKKFCENLSS